MKFKHIIISFIALTSITSCGGGSSNSQESPPVSSTPNDEMLTVLMIGNSHTVVNNIPKILSTILQKSPEQTENYVQKATSSAFLYQHSEDNSTLATFDEKHWDFVVLQAQRYSQSQSIDYPTDAAEAFIRKTKNQVGQPILFPEWARFGVNETDYIHKLHTNIASKETACVAPIGIAWEKALSLNTNLRLHADDGNHANFLGSYLAALVLYETITGNPADLLGELPLDEDVPIETQSFLQAVAENPPCPT